MEGVRARQKKELAILFARNSHKLYHDIQYDKICYQSVRLYKQRMQIFFKFIYLYLR